MPKFKKRRSVAQLNQLAEARKLNSKVFVSDSRGDEVIEVCGMK